jgi:hypothetical protein
MKATMPASSLRGTVTSSRIVVGATRASAANAERRAVARRSDSSAVRPRARRSRRACARACAMISASSATTAGWPSVSISRTASASRGRPTFAKSSTQLIVVRSRNSSVQGMIGCAMIAETVSAASAPSSRRREQRFLRRGLGQQRSRILVKMPSVPSEPMKTSRSE